MKGKALVISVGTGTRQDAQESLAHGICCSIKGNNPDHTVFVVTKESRDKTLPLIKNNLGASLKSCEEHQLSDADNVSTIYKEMAALLKGLKKEYNELAVDFTSGTKAMSGGLTIAACLLEVDALCYITGERQNGIVAKGTEELKYVSPLAVTSDRRLAEAVLLFNRHQYDGVTAIVNELEKTTSSDAILSKFNDLKTAALAYSYWDKFNHNEARGHLRNVKNEIFNENKRFFAELDKGNDKEPYYVADLINNAKRRADEGKYDDAVARLYRTTELLSQYSLKEHDYPSTENVEVDKLPSEIIDKYQLKKGSKCNIALDMGWNILAVKGDTVAQEYIEDNAIKDALNKRNKSILAHGLEPLKKDDFDRLLNRVLNYARLKIPRLDDYLRWSAFCEWPL